MPMHESWKRNDHKNETCHSDHDFMTSQYMGDNSWNYLNLNTWLLFLNFSASLANWNVLV